MQTQLKTDILINQWVLIKEIMKLTEELSYALSQWDLVRESKLRTLLDEKQFELSLLQSI